ncbi:MAG: ferritin-like domain-containing protein [Deltaproteobacteria bacterium]|nr:MAG: ferritin-like domain-containing protein [Deltaproteobacteria bacterium]
MSQPAAVNGLDIETLEVKLDTIYNWGYEQARQDLRQLYTKAKRHQWIPEDTLPWDTDVDPERPNGPPELFPLAGADLYTAMSEREQARLNHEVTAWVLSQFLHGEQGALLATAQIVNAVPGYSAKLYGATQVVDEARHVEVYDRYLREKIEIVYPCNQHLRTLLDIILKDGRWDMKFLGMQIMVEGLALSAFAMIHQTTTEPLLRELTRYVMQDEARHVAFGVLSLRSFYDEMPEAERRDREDFVYEAARLMRDRFLFQEVWEKTGLPVQECMDITLHNEGQKMFRGLLFSKIVPAVKKIGLLSDTTRQRFAELGILHYETWQDPAEAELADVTADAPG